MSQGIKTFVCVLLTVLRYCWVGAYAPETVKIMPFVLSNKECVKCHTKNEASAFKGKTAQSCYSFCRSCHDDLRGHHEVDKRLARTPSRKMQLKESNKVTCYTCHDLHNKRYDSISWKSESLFESIFSSKKRYKTFYLTEINRNGNLCRRCH